MKMSSLIVILCAVFSALPTDGRASPGISMKTSRCFPRGVADPEGERAYIRNTAGGIDSVDLETGQLNWTTTAASVPLLIDGTHLLAWKYINENVIQIVKIDSKTGESLTTSEPINFPAGIKVSPIREHDFGIEAKVTVSTLELVWRGRTLYEGGAPPPPDVVHKWQKQLSGVFRIDLATGNVTSQSTGNVSATLEAPTSPLTSIDHVDWKIADRVVKLSSKREPQGEALFMKPAGRP